MKDDTLTPFEQMAPALAGALTARGYEKLTPVQEAMLAPNAQDADLLVSAQTGSGKTVAFGIAIEPTILGGADAFVPADKPYALIIAPTRELAIQVQRELGWLYEKAGARIATCVGGMDIRTERRALSQGAHIVVGTPGRLRDHITRGSLDMSELRAVVLDEADEMLDLGFRDDLEFILAAAPEERRTLMFSATVPPQIAQLAKTFQRDAVRINAVSETRQHADIDYKLMMVPAQERDNAIINTLLFYEATNTIIFCHTRESVKHMTSRLANRGFPVVQLSGELSQAERTNALQSMRDGRARICVATDVAARGIDLPGLDLVIHADLPSNPDTLLHRSGRTGRAGRKGTCVLMVPLHRRGAASRVLKLAKLEAEAIGAPTIEVIEERSRQAILTDARLSEPVQEEEAGFIAELLAAHGAEAIAAAYLRLQIAARPPAEDVSVVPLTPEPRGKNRSFDGPGTPGAPTDRFENGIWFKASVGRKHRAEPRWLLPLICKAGHITKGSIGAIRIQDSETLFEIRPEHADDFASAVKGGTGEKGVTIRRADGPPAPYEGGKPSFGDKPKFNKGKKPFGGNDGGKPAYAKKPYKAKSADGAPRPEKFSKPEGAPSKPKKPKKPKANWAP